MRIMLDTNVLISMLVFKSFNAVIDKITQKYSIVLCSYVIDELHEVIERKFPNKQKDIEKFLMKLPFELVYTPKTIEEHDLFKIRDASITLSELEQMQKEVENIKVPDSINELMDNVLCALRQNGVHVSDRKFFGFTPIVRAKAYLNGNTEITSKDLLVLKNYFWNSPEEIQKVERILTDICENPIGAEVEKLLTMARECMAELDAVEKDSPDYMKLYVKCNAELFKI